VTTTDPIVIGFEQIQSAAHALGMTDLAHLQELRIEPDKVTVVRYRLDGGERVYIADGWLTDTSTIPVVYDDEAAQAVAEGGVA
jgi:hypothetical protein